MSLGRSLNRSFIVSLLFAVAAVAFAPATRAAIPEDVLKRAAAIPLTTELLEKMEKFVASVKTDAAAKAELAAFTKENKDNPPRGEAWGKAITPKCPKTVALFQAAGVTAEDFGKAVDVIETILFAEGMAPAGDPDNLGKSEDKTVAANAAFVAANKARAEAVYGAFIVFGLLE
jgi:hypothetical protein